MTALDESERQRAATLAVGRLLRIMSRPFQQGDLETYEAVRRVVMECADRESLDQRPNWARDRLKGASGD